MTTLPPPSGTPEPAGIARGARYFPELECLRGAAIALVVLFHANGLVRMPFGNMRGTWAPLPLALIYGGHTGVSLFFVLSGFLLGLPFLAELAGERRVDRRVYYEKRVLRILPIYWALLVVALSVTASPGDDVLPRLGYFVFLNSVPHLVKPMQPFTDVVWSLATEVQFYAVLPLLPFCVRSRRRAALLLLAFVALYLSLVVGPLATMPPRDFLINGVVGRLPQFAAGIGVAWWYRRRRARHRGPLLGPGTADAILVAALATIAVLVRPVIHDGYFIWNVPPRFVWHVPEGLCWAIVLLVVVDGRPLLRPLLVNAPLARLGILSYSIYLLHMPLLWYSLGVVRRFYPLPAGWSPSTLVWLLAVLALLVALSEVTYRLIERPFLVRKATLGPASSSVPDTPR